MRYVTPALSSTHWLHLRIMPLEYLRSPSGFDADKLLMAMRLAGWKRNGPFFCVCMELTEAGQELHSAAYESVLFDHQLYGYLSLEYEDRLLLL